MKIAPASTRASASLCSRLALACLTPFLLASISTQAQAQANPKSSAPAKKAIISLHATGPEATSKGTMLAAGTGAKNSSGGYVALEIVTGSLKGRTGTFVLQHSATMNRGVPQLSITVVPDSGTGQLTGLAGKMNITIADGKHSYDFEYTLPENP